MQRILFAAWLGLLAGGGMAIHSVTAAAPVEEPTVIGMEISRPSGGYLGVVLEGVSLVVRFYNEEKELIPAEADRASIWWNAPNRTARQRAVLIRDGEGRALRSPQQVRPPYAYMVSLTLLRADGSTLEHHQVDMREVATYAAP